MTSRSRPNLRRGKLAETTPRNCRYCDVPMVVRPRTGELPRNRHCGLGLCAHCYARRERLKWAQKDPPRKPATRWRALDILTEWERLRAADRSLTSRAVARRLGITYEHLDRSLCRARVYRKRDAHLIEAQREREALEAAVYWAEIEAHRINDDMIAYALRKAG